MSLEDTINATRQRLRNEAAQQATRNAAREADTAQKIADQEKATQEITQQTAALGQEVVRLLQAHGVPAVPVLRTRKSGTLYTVGEGWVIGSTSGITAEGEAVKCEIVSGSNPRIDASRPGGVATESIPALVEPTTLSPHAASAILQSAETTSAIAAQLNQLESPAEALPPPADLDRPDHRNDAGKKPAPRRLHPTPHETAKAQSKIDAMVDTMNIPTAVEAAANDALRQGQLSEARGGQVLIDTSGINSHALERTDATQLQSTIRRVMSDYIASRQELANWSFSLMSSRDGKQHYIVASPPAHEFSDPHFPPAISGEQAALLHDLRTQSAQIGHVVTHGLEHLHDHHIEHDQHIIEAMALLRPRVEHAREVALRRDNHTFRVPYRRTVRPMQKHLRTDSENETFAYMEDALAQLANDYPGYSITSTRERTGHLAVTITRTDADRPAHH